MEANTTTQQILTPEELMKRVKSALRMREVMKHLAMFDYFEMDNFGIDIFQPTEEQLDEFKAKEKAYSSKNADKCKMFSKVEFRFNPESNTMEYSYFSTADFTAKEFKTEAKLKKALLNNKFVSQSIRKDDGTYVLNVTTIPMGTKFTGNVTISYSYEEFMDKFADAIKVNDVKEAIEEYVVFSKEMDAEQKSMS